jgi:hypothetical protein
VEVARERWERALQLGAEPGVDTAGALAGFAAALDAARGLGERSRPLAAELACRLRSRAEEEWEVSRLEAWLAEAEGGLLDALRAEAGPGALAGVEAAVDADLSPYRERMPAQVLAQIRADAIARRLLEAHGLPRLSLFHL